VSLVMSLFKGTTWFKKNGLVIIGWSYIPLFLSHSWYIYLNSSGLIDPSRRHISTLSKPSMPALMTLTLAWFSTNGYGSLIWTSVSSLNSSFTASIVFMLWTLWLRTNEAFITDWLLEWWVDRWLNDSIWFTISD
jgi:hypothetical protein